MVDSTGRGDLVKKDVAGQTITAQLTNRTTGQPVTTGTVTVYILIDAGVLTLGTGTIAHEGEGLWSYVPTQAETNGDQLSFQFRHTDAVYTAPQLFTVPTPADIADAFLGRNISGGSNTGRLVKQALHFLRNKWSISGGTLTVTDTDDVTESWTAQVTTDASASPVTGNDPG